MEQYRSKLKDKKRIVVKIGSSSLQHPQTGELDYIKLEVLVRELCNLRNQGKDVVLVTSGAIAQGRRAMHLSDEDFSQNRIAMKQACAAIGQARLMMTYERIFAEYSQVTAQILLTKNTVVDNLNRQHTISDTAAVYVYDGREYQLSSLDRVAGGEYRLTAWCDKPENEGGRIRVILAR